MLFPGELAKIQADAVAATCDQTCTIARATLTDEVQGGQTGVYTTVATSVCGVALPTPGELQNFTYVVGTLAVWLVRMPVGTNVLSEDRLTIGSLTMTVNRVSIPRSYPALLTALATEVG